MNLFLIILLAILIAALIIYFSDDADFTVKFNDTSMDIAPQVYWRVKPGKYYTIMMIDMNAPAGIYLHWLVINIKDPQNIKKAIMPYIKPSPPPGTGTHHYFVQLYEQNGPIILKSLIFRVEFSVRQFVNTYELRLLQSRGFTVKAPSL
jgi:phosphatidylethanolamine-binding protein (PEBP) family uncharacterized protein